MSWWQRLGFSVFSLILGWVSLDYILAALRFMHLIAEKGHVQNAIEYELLGAGMLIGFLLLLTLYLWILRKISGDLNIIEYEKPEEKPKIRSKWFDVFLQGGFLATGFFLRFFFVIVFYLPGIQ